MRKLFTRLGAMLLALLIGLMLTCGALAQAMTDVLVDEGVALALRDAVQPDGSTVSEEFMVELGESYYSPDEVALYLYAFCELPENFLIKSEARALGWRSNEGNLWDVAPGAAIGGDTFGNREGLLPDEYGRKWYECDVNYAGGFRGGERIVFASDGLIYYTADHYQSFEPLYNGWYDPEAEYGAVEEEWP